MEGEANEQPFHLDGTVPWLKMSNGKLATALSCVILLGDAPSTVLGTLLTDFWVNTDKEIAEMLQQEILECQKEKKTPTIRRAGHVTIFPLGYEIVMLLLKCC